MSAAKILIVEDEVVIALGIKVSLEKLDYEVVGISSLGEKAVIDARDLNPDLILMDIILPGGIDGIEAARKIHIDNDVPIIYLTANADRATVERARDTQPYGYLNKPINQQDLLTSIDSALTKHRMERRLRESEEKYHSLIDSLHDGILSVDENGFITYLSPQITEISGYNESEMIGKNFLEFIHPDDRKEVLRLFGLSRQGKPEYGEYRGIHKSGESIWLRTSGRPSHRDGLFNGLNVIVSDITMEKKSEGERRRTNEELLSANEELQAAMEELEAINEQFELQNKELEAAKEELSRHEAMLQKIINVAPVGVGVIKNRVVEWINNMYLDMFGYTEGDVRGKSLRVFYDTENEYRSAVREMNGQITAKGWASFEVMAKHRNGSLFNVLINVVPFDRNTIDAGLVFAVMDISEQKRAVEALNESEEKYRLLVENITDSVWVLDLATMEFVYNSPSSVNILGYTVEESRHYKITDIVVPRYIESIGRLLSDELSRDGQPGVDPNRIRTIEIEQIHKNGSIVWVEMTLRFLRDAEGKPVSILGLSRNVTERKRAEMALAEVEEKYRLLMENSPENLWVIDLKTMRFVYNSPYGTQILGYNDAETHNLRLEDILPPDSLTLVMKALSEELAQDGLPGVNPNRTRTFEIEEIHKNGSRLWVETTMKFLRDESGKPYSIMGVSRDITPRRYAEELIRLQRDLAQALSATSSLDDAMALSLEMAVRGSKMDSGGVYLRESGTGGLKLLCHVGLGSAFVARYGYLGPDSDNTRMAMKGKPVYFSYADIETMLNGTQYEEKLMAVAVIPVTHKGSVVAIMNISSHTRDEIPETARNTLESIAAQLGDVIIRLEIQESLKKSEEQFRMVIDNSPFPIALIENENGRFTYFNKSLIHTLGYTIYDVPDMNTWWTAAYEDEEYRERNREAWNKAVDTALARGTGFKSDEVDVRCKDGTYRHIEFRMMPMGRQSVIMINDLTEKKIHQEMMIQTEKMTSLGGLAAGMAHEINNPLGIILQGIQGTLSRLSPEVKKNREEAERAGTTMETILSYIEKREIMEYLNGIQDAGQRAAKIVSNMLQFSRRSESVIAPVDLHQLIDKTIEIAANDYDLKKKYDFKKIQVVRNYDRDLGLVPCSETGIEQVVLNLLKNSSQAMATVKAGGFQPVVTIRTGMEGGMAVIEISDNGPGIDAKIQRHIFEPFYTTKGIGFGTGLGLSVSYYIITKAHNGTIDVFSKPGKGAVFTIKLPLERQP